MRLKLPPVLASILFMLAIYSPKTSCCEERKGEQITVSVPEMHCPACARTISSALSNLSSVDRSHHDFKARTVTIHSSKTGAISDEEIANTISKLRYKAASVERLEDS